MAQKSQVKKKGSGSSSMAKTKSKAVVGKGTRTNSKRSVSAALWRRQPIMAAVFVLGFGLIGALLVWAIFADAPEEMIDHKSVALAYNEQMLTDVKNVKANPGNAQAVGKLKQTAKERKQAMQDLMREDPASFLTIAKTDGFAGDVPADVTADTEHAVKATGRLVASITESLDPDGKEVKEATAQTHYALVDASGVRRPLFVDKELDAKYINQTVAADAIQLGDNYAAASSTVVGTSPDVHGETLAAQMKNIAIVLVNFKSDTSKPTSLTTVNSLALGSGGILNSYYSQVTNNRIGFTGKSFGYYTIADSPSTCDSDAWNRSAYAAAGGDAVLGSYTNVMFVAPFAPSCNWGGQGDVGGKFVWINGPANFNQNLLVHEVGHNLGLSHARTAYCTDANNAVVSISDTCQTSEYGDPYDAEGNNTMGFSSPRRVYLGAIPLSNVITATAGTYTIAPIQDVTTTPQMIKVPRTYDSTGKVSDYYYVDFRRAQSSGYDLYSADSNPVKGVQIRKGPDQSITGIRTDLIDTSAGSQGGYGDSALISGLDFYDASRNVRISTKSVTADSATITINGAASTACVRQLPVVSLSPYSAYGNPGGTVSTTINVKSTDTNSCTAGTYSLTSSMVAGFTQSPSTLSFTLSPGETKSIPVTVTAPATVPATYNYLGEIINSPAGAVSNTFGYNVQQPTGTTAGPSVRVVQPADGAVISASTQYQATVSSFTRVQSFKLYLDGRRVAQAKGQTLSYTLNPSRIGAGAHTLVVQAVDANGRSSAVTTNITVQ